MKKLPRLFMSVSLYWKLVIEPWDFIGIWDLDIGISKGIFFRSELTDAGGCVP
jgi:hypothetical protein